MKIIEKCYTCHKQHTIDFDPIIGPGSGFSDWITKHPGHRVDFEFPQRSNKTNVNKKLKKGKPTLIHKEQNQPFKELSGQTIVSVSFQPNGSNGGIISIKTKNS